MEPLFNCQAHPSVRVQMRTEPLFYLISSNIPDGTVTLVVRSIGFQEKSISLTFPLGSNDSVEILLQANEEELGEVIITSTRISRNIENIPTRVESISFEEIDEKTNMRPTNVALLSMVA